MLMLWLLCVGTMTVRYSAFGGGGVGRLARNLQHGCVCRCAFVVVCEMCVMCMMCGVCVIKSSTQSLERYPILLLVVRCFPNSEFMNFAFASSVECTCTMREKTK